MSHSESVLGQRPVSILHPLQKVKRDHSWEGVQLEAGDYCKMNFDLEICELQKREVFQLRVSFL